MNWSLIYSTGIHILFFLLLMVAVKPEVNLQKATYTIDFIGGATEVAQRYGNPEPVPPAQTKEPATTPESEIPAPPKPEPKKEAAKPKPQYAAKEQITKKPVKAKTPPKPEPEAPKVEEKVVLKKPSILGDVDSANIDPAVVHNITTDAAGDNVVRASFTNFPYPWYITLVRNALWREWTKRMPKNKDLSTFVSFNIDKHGAIYSVQIEKSSGNDTYDFAAMASASNSAPYPPLPKEFPKDILTVTVEFKSEN